jgi:hypothetical protein
MNSTNRKRLIPWLVVAALSGTLALCLLWILPRDGEDAPDVEGSGDSGGWPSSDDFIISGSTTPPMTPGLSAPLDLSLTNTSDVAIQVSSLTVAVRGVTAPNADAGHPCSAADFTVHQGADRLDLSLAAGETGSLSTLHVPLASWPRVQLKDLPVNQDGCKQATLILDYSGAGTRDE